MATATTPELSKKDFQTDQEVRWCPGCGDYAILNAAHQTFASLGIPRERFVVVSGIGCAARFPYYTNTYGFHTIHGRAPAVATGVKLANPELSVWVISGDGDALSIGGNHLIHVMRRNVDLNIVMFNNRIYGLTKGQYSPTSEVGKRTKSTPLGSLDRPFNPISLAMGAGATFVGRGVDVQNPELRAVLERAAQHRGTSYVEVMQNCNIFNDGAWKATVDKPVRDEMELVLEHGKPLVFGKDKNKGLRLDGVKLEVVGLDSCDESEILVHDETDRALGLLLSQIGPPAFPTPIGVFHASEAPTLETGLAAQFDEAVKRKGEPNLDAMLAGPAAWKVEPA